MDNRFNKLLLYLEKQKISTKNLFAIKSDASFRKYYRLENNILAMDAAPEKGESVSKFLEIKNNCERLFRELLDLPDHYSLIWTHGGGHAQFSAVPLNIVKQENESPNYIVTGTWSNRSYIEAEKFCKPNNSKQKENILKIYFV